MATFLTICFIFFLLALLVLGIALYKMLSAIKKVGRKLGVGVENARRQRYDRGRSRYRNRRTRIIPPEYGVDVEYEILALTGSECFVRVSEVLSHRGEFQISDAEYTVIVVTSN